MPVSEQIRSDAAPRRKLWTREEALKLTELFPGSRYELIEGELIDKMGQNPPHSYVIARLNALLAATFPDRIRIQSSISLPDPDGRYSEPEPDVVVLNRDNDFFDRHPGPADIALLVEVSDTTFSTDRQIKYRLYARAGIAEYWIIDILKRRAIVCRNPAGEDYRSVTIFDDTAVIAPAQLPDCPVSLSAVLPPV